MMKTNLTTIPMCPRERFASYKSSSRLVLCYKKDWATLLHFFTIVTYYPLQIILSQNYLLPIILVLAENTLLKTACHFLLLLIGFNILTYQKDYDRSPILVGQHSPPNHNHHPTSSYRHPVIMGKKKMTSEEGLRNRMMWYLGGYQSEVPPPDHDN